MWSKYYAHLSASTLGSAAAGAAATALVGAALTLLATHVFGSYGYALFVATPLALGFFAAVIHGLSRERSEGESIAVGATAVGLVSIALLALAQEGAICIVMALPLTLGLGVIGALLGHAVHRRRRRVGRQALSVVLAIPFLLGLESSFDDRPPLRAVTTAVVVDAPPHVVWAHVVAVEPLPEPDELLFRAGVAYPTRATIDGTGVGAVRRCTFSTGDFVEPITVWEPGRRLEFRVVAQPPPLKELSPWGGVNPPHLDGFLRSERGRFELVPLPGGRTLLRGTSWYRNRMWPQAYWGTIADYLMRRIHLRVLTHVERLAESAATYKTLTAETGFSAQAGNRFGSVSALAYDLRGTTGYIVADSQGRVIGKVEAPMYGTRPDEPDAVAVRKGFFARRRHLVPVEEIEQIDATSGVIGLRIPRERIRSFL